MKNIIDSQDISEITSFYTYGTWRFQKGWKPLQIVDAEGCHFTDANGKTYLDFSSQLMCVNLGHKNKAIIDAIEKQAKKLAYVAPGFTTDVRAELSKLLVEILPDGLDKFFFTTSGTEANEAAIKIAKMFTGKSKIIARYRSYHGSTMGSIAATGDPRRWSAEPSGKISGVIFAPEVNCYDCPINHTYPTCEIACVEYIEHMIENESDVAAVIIEPVVGTNGVLIPPKEYLPRLRKICDDNNVLLIADEVMSGWCRTGKWFAVDNWNVIPDILVTAKGITNAAIPLGLCATSRKIANYFDDHLFSHGHTYEAHPLTLAPAIAAINEMKRLNLNDRANKIGKFLGEKLSELKSKHISVGDVRGIGLFWCVELVKNQITKEPFNSKLDKVSGKQLLVDKVSGEMMKNGVFIQPWLSHFVIAPPLIISEEEILVGIKALDNALTIADNEIKS
ncbi:MAG: aspartate aminotransferase family protein [Ignavibacteria bacterium]|nr:aspartate aminotransferase family protein [Bacteroidota bacterium]MSQ45829.1 aspartate aminotransferase family protein [Ignavibacteria bacterium]